MIEDPALDDMLKAARLDEGYQSVAETIKQKKDKEVYKTVSTAAIKEYIGHRVERMSVIEKLDALIMLMDQTRIVVPPSMRKKLINREHLAHTGINKMQMSIRAKYFSPGIEADGKKIGGGVQAMPATQQDSEKGPTQAGLGVCELADAVGRHRLFQETWEQVSSLNGPLLRIANVCSDVLQHKTAHTFKQLKRWFSTFGMSRSNICVNGPPFFSRGFQEFCNEYCIQLNLTTSYNPESSGAAEREIGLIKTIIKKTEEEGLCFEESLAVFRNTSNERGYSLNQMFFLRIWQDQKFAGLAGRACGGRHGESQREDQKRLQQDQG